jgi:hypothetical protein
LSDGEDECEKVDEEMRSQSTCPNRRHAVIDGKKFLTARKRSLRPCKFGRLSVPAIALVVAIGCFWVVVHAATDWDELKSQGRPTVVRLEPPEYGKDGSALKSAADVVAAQWEDMLIPRFTSVDIPKAITLNLRI